MLSASISVKQLMLMDSWNNFRRQIVCAADDDSRDEMAAEAEGAAALDDGEDVDVIWEGSPLHEHMKQLGLESPDADVAAKGRLIDARARAPAAGKPGSILKRTFAVVRNVSFRVKTAYFHFKLRSLLIYIIWVSLL